MAVLKTIVDFVAMLIVAEVAKTPAGVRGWGDPAGALAPRRLPGTPAESEATGAKINNHVKHSQINKEGSYILHVTPIFIYTSIYLYNESLNA
jgi:hypothetical protein